MFSLLAGGNWNNNTNAGISNFNVNNTSTNTNTNIGARILLKNKNFAFYNPHHLVKIKPYKAMSSNLGERC